MKKRIVKNLIAVIAGLTLCNLCGGQATGCIYDGIKNGEPVTIGQLPINDFIMVQWGS